MAASAFALVRATASMASSALSFVRPTASMAVVGLGVGAPDGLDGGVGLGVGPVDGLDRLIGLVVGAGDPRDDLVGAVHHPVDPGEQRRHLVEQLLHPAQHRGGPRDERQGVRHPVARAGDGGDDVGRAGDRGQSHRQHATHVPRCAHLRGTPSDGAAGDTALRASGGRGARLPYRGGLPPPGRDAEQITNRGVDTGGGRADGRRRGCPRRPRRLPATTGRGRAADRRAAAGPPGRAHHRRPPRRPPPGRTALGAVRAAARGAERAAAGAGREHDPAAHLAGRPAARARRRAPAPHSPRCPARPPTGSPTSGPSRRSGPIPPLPGTVPPVRTGSTRLRPPRPARRELSPRPPPAGPCGRGPGRRRRRGAALPPGPLLLRRPEDRPGRRAGHRRPGDPRRPAAGGLRDLPRRRHRRPRAGRTRLGGDAARLGVAEDGERAVLVGFPPSALVDTPECRTPDGELRAPTTEAFAPLAARRRPLLHGPRGAAAVRPAGRPLPRAWTWPGCPAWWTRSAASRSASCPPGRRQRRRYPPPPGRRSSPARRRPATCGPGRAGPTPPAPRSPSAPSGCSPPRCARRCRGTPSLDPPALARFLSRAADALTVDEQTTLGDLRALATSLGNVSGDAVAAHRPAGRPGGATCRPAAEEAFVLLDGGGHPHRCSTRSSRTAACPDGFAAESDAPPEAAGEAPPAEAAVAADPGTALVPPAEVTVDVLNGTGTSGLAATVADELRGVGFGVGPVGNDEGTRQPDRGAARPGPGGAGAHRRRRRPRCGAAGQRHHRRHRAAGHRSRLLDVGPSPVPPAGPRTRAARRRRSTEAAAPVPEAAAVQLLSDRLSRSGRRCSPRSPSRRGC